MSAFAQQPVARSEDERSSADLLSGCEPPLYHIAFLVIPASVGFAVDAQLLDGSYVCIGSEAERVYADPGDIR
ncbi:hypothetical protein ACFS27_22060 [Promicromonospora vindobonensis]|uniref:Uncharacterized protein n=1 Tax=Promicromonospora vindobonensis TaxID=195748 RepID=A0ABW5VX81_9MICO